MPQKCADFSDALIMHSTLLLSDDRTNTGHAEQFQHSTIILEIPCHWENYVGTLTASFQGMIFCGSFFLFETIVSMSWTDILRMRYDVDQQGLIVTLRREQQNHAFLQFPQSHLVQLMHLQNEALSSRRLSACSSVATSVTSFSTQLLDTEDNHTCRTNTVEASMTSLAERLPDSVIASHTGIPLFLQDVNISHDDIKGRFFAGPKGLVFTGRRYFWDHVILILPWNSIWKIQKQDQAVLVRSHNSQDYRLIVTEDDALEGIWETLVSCHNMQLTKTTTEPPSSVCPQNACTGQLVGTTAETSPLEHVVVASVEIPSSLQEFEELFLKDQAKFSLATFLESRGDSEVETSTWDDDTERVVRYIHPVLAPMAPPQARARKEQRWVRYVNNNHDTILVETKTIVDDVPMTDCFYVLDRITAKQIGAKTVQVRMEFEIVFVKSTMFRGIIRQTTSKEFVAMFQSLADYYLQCSIEPGEVVPSAMVLPLSGREPAKSTGLALCYILWAATFVLQILILRELRDLKARMAN